MKYPIILGVFACLFGGHLAAMTPVVEIEEPVYTFTPANNGAGPMWCHGSTCLVRTGDRLFATGLETVHDAKPLNNCRWKLYERRDAGWEVVYLDQDGRTREPSPTGAFGSGKVIVSVNPTLGKAAEPNGGPARPDVLQFDAATPSTGPVSLAPEWQGTPRFTEHSYRSLAADREHEELILFQNIDYTHAEWTFRERSGKWSARGRLEWPWAADYEKPQPLRLCYPNVAVRDRAVHFFGVSDIFEPRAAWRDFKHELTGQHWDYDFCRLYYTWSADITWKPFSEWVEIANRDATCGQLTPEDLYASANGEVHLLWTERAIDERLRPKFFPEARQSHALNYAVLKDGKVVRRKTLVESTEEKPGIVASNGRFQITPDGRLFVLYYAGGMGSNGRGVSENRLCEIRKGLEVSDPLRIPLKKPLTSFFTATIRAGSPPSNVIDLLGQPAGSGDTIAYARIRLVP